MAYPDSTSASQAKGYSAGSLILAFVLGVVATVLLYATGVVGASTKLVSKAVGGGQTLVSLEAYRLEEIKKVRAIAAEVAAEKKKPQWQVSVEELQQNPKIKSMGLDEMSNAMVLQAAIAPASPNEPAIPNLEGYSPVDFSNKASKVYNYSIIRQPAFNPGQTTVPEPTVVSFGDEYAGKKFFVYRLEITPKPTKGPDGKVLPPRPAQKVTFGPVEEDELNKQIESVKAQVDVKKIALEGSTEMSVPARIYANKEGKLALVIEGKVSHPHRIINRGPIAYYTIPVSELQVYMKDRAKDPSKGMPPAEQALIAIRE